MEKDKIQKLYQFLCTELQNMAPELPLFKKEEDYLCEQLVKGEYFEVRIRMRVNEQRGIITLFSLLPFVVPEPCRSEFANWITDYNYDNFYEGCYDFNPDDGKIVFRMSLPILEAKEYEQVLHDKIQFAYFKVNETNGYVNDKVKELEARLGTEVVSEETESDTETSADANEYTKNMVGWDAFKEMCQELCRTAPYCLRNNRVSGIRYQSYLFAVDSGYGLTTALRNLKQLLQDVEKVNFQHKGMKEILLGTSDGNGRMDISDAIEFLSSSENEHLLVCFDISEFMNTGKHNDLKNFLSRIVEFEDKYTFAFRIPFLEQETLQKLYRVINDVLYVRLIPVAPFSGEMLQAAAKQMLREEDCEVSTEAWEIFQCRIREEKGDGRFYGLRTVRKVVREMVYLQCVQNAKQEEQEKEFTIRKNAILPLAPTYQNVSRNGFDELSKLVGMEEITERIREIVNQLKMAMAVNLERPCLHMRFTGSPGTGKTTVARILGQILQENGILRNGYFFEYTGRDLCGQYVGQTAPRTAGICRDAYGSVLFIDEAYSLYSSEKSDNDYGREALTTLISEMENHRDDMVVIMAGYKEDMDKLMEGNAGLRSRMPFVLEFKNYTKEQLYQIYMKFVGEHFRYTPDFDEAAKQYFETLSDSYVQAEEFANARFARNLYERTWSKAALRCSLESFQDVELTKEDFLSASSEKEFSEKLAEKRTIGFK